MAEVRGQALVPGQRRTSCEQRHLVVRFLGIGAGRYRLGECCGLAGARRCQDIQINQRRVADLDLPSPQRQRQALARRAEGDALGAAGMVKAGKQFGRLNGLLHLRSLLGTPEKVTEPVGATGRDKRVQAGRLTIIGPPPKFYGTRDILECSNASPTYRKERGRSSYSPDRPTRWNNLLLP
jgi:hypothetical protein